MVNIVAVNVIAESALESWPVTVIFVSCAEDYLWVLCLTSSSSR